MEAMLSIFGLDRSFELIEYLVLFFVLVSVTTLIFVGISLARNRRSSRDSDKRLETILRHLGRGLFGEDAWFTVEQNLAGDPKKIDAFLSVLDRESFEVWADAAEQSGLVTPSDIELLRHRLARSDEPQRRTQAPVPGSAANPTFGMPVAVQQGSYQTRGTIADVDEQTFSLWVLGEDSSFDDSRPASFVLLSRSGTYQFDSEFRLLQDGTMTVNRPARSLQNQRRRYERYAARLPVDIARFPDGDETETATITELSGGGATVTDPDGLFQEGQVLNLAFSAGGKSFTVPGRIVRADDGALHIRFEAIRDQERVLIAESVITIE